MSYPSQPGNPLQPITATQPSHQMSDPRHDRPESEEPESEEQARAHAAVSLIGAWTISDGAEAFTLVFIPLQDNIQENIFEGRCVDVPDPSLFLAQLLTTARGTVLSMVQTHPERQYVAAYGAYRLPSGDFAGSWTDVDGNTAEFELIRASPPDTSEA